LSGISLESSLKALERLAPPALAESWDNSGLQVGDPKTTVKRALIALDPSPETISEAIKTQSNLIVTHHPLLFKPLSTIDLSHPTGKIIATLINESIALYCSHTNLDRATGGLNDILAKRLGLTDLAPLCKGEQLSKVVVTTPTDNAQEMIRAMSGAGAGKVGDYSACAFTSTGSGEFTPGAGADPFIGERGVATKVEEARIEMVAPTSRLAEIKKAALAAHPYEEPAYDVYPMNCTSKEGALGRVGELSDKLPLSDFSSEVRSKLGVKGVRYVGDGGKMIGKVAVCGGSGASLWPLALASGADVLVTGDVKHHDALDANASGIALVDAGHSGTEEVALEMIAELVRKCGVEATVFHQPCPFEWISD
jgi:dinuclear metal center YbgI/SA1388 family protein